MERLGRYRVLEPLADGGQGVVVRAYDPDLRVERAIKVLPQDLAADATSRARLRREAQLASRLRHPRICGIHDVGEDAGRLFVVMDLLSGVTLRDRLTAGALAPDEARRIALEIADALAYAHAQSVVHRDLSSANVMLLEDGHVALLDFGLARLLPGEATASLTDVTATGVIMGTPDYIAPEVLSGSEADAPSDVWALGVLLYEMLVGVRPFRGRGVTETLAAVLHAPVPPLPRGVPAWMVELVRACLQKDPAVRIASAVEVKRRLEGAHVGAPRGPSWRGALIGGALVAGVVLAAVLLLGHPSSIHALAVLPLENRSGDAAQDYFAAGMTDELTVTLGQIHALQVIAHADYDLHKVSPAHIAQELGVGGLVTGSVLRSGDRVRIVVQLLDTSGRVRWTNAYERGMRDVIALQNEVSQAIAAQIRAELTPGERSRLAQAPAVDPQAYEDYLRGRIAWSSYTEHGFAEADRLFRLALARDSTWAPVWAGLADAAYGPSYLYIAPNQAIPRARAAAEHALRLDPGSSEAHTSLGITRLVYDWDWDAARREFERAITLRSGNADAHWWLGHLRVLRGETDGGLAELQRAIALDPTNDWYRYSLAWHLYFGRREPAAAESLRILMTRGPENYLGHVFLGLVRGQQGDRSGAVTELEAGVHMVTNNDDLSQLGYAYGRAGRRADAERILQRLRERQRTRFVPAGSFAMVYAGLDDRAAALDWFNRELDDHSETVLFAGVEPAWDALRGDPRFQAVLQRVHLRS